MPDSTQQWLEQLTERLDEQSRRLLPLRDYVTGNAPLPEGASQNRESFARWQRLARTDFPNLIVDAVAERMKIAGFRVADDPQDNDAARALWRRSLGDSLAPDVHRDMLTYGLGYAMAAAGRSGAVLTRESPFSTITDHDPLEPMWVRAGLKVWRDGDIDWAVLHLPGTVQRFTRGTSMRAVGGWEPVGPPQRTRLDRVPIVRFTNRDAVGEFALHTDLLDRINWVILQRLLIIAMQAFRQRAIKGDLPDVDSEGNEIDYSEVFLPGPDALWELPEGVDIWESTPGDITGILSAVKDDLRDLSAVTRTPMSVLSPDSANQSAEGAALTREGLVFKVDDRIGRATPSWDGLVGLGLALDGQQVQVQTQWAPAERQSLTEKADAAVKLASALPWRRLMTDVLGYPADEVDRMESERAADALTALLTAPTPAPAAVTDTATGNG